MFDFVIWKYTCVFNGCKCFAFKDKKVYDGCNCVIRIIDEIKDVLKFTEYIE